MEMNHQRVILLTGVSYLGLCQLSKELKEGRKDVVIVRLSDVVRNYPDVTNKEEQFNLFVQRIERIIKEGKHVIAYGELECLDNRQQLIKALPFVTDIYAIHYVCPYEKARQFEPFEVVMNRMKYFDFPLKEEGLSDVYLEYDVEIYQTDFPPQVERAFQEEIEQNTTGIHLIEELATFFPALERVISVPQESLWYPLSMDREAYYWYKTVTNETNEERRIIYQLTALFHNLGKPLVQVFPNEVYAEYPNYANVSTHLAFPILKHMGYSEEVIQQVVFMINYQNKDISWLNSEQQTNILTINHYKGAI